MTKDEIKSLVNSVNMVKNMVESIVTAVQERFKEYDNVIVTLKEKIENLENSVPTTGHAISQTSAPDFSDQLSRLETRLDSLNERILLIEAARSVYTKPISKPSEVQIAKETPLEETKQEFVRMPQAPARPPPTPEIMPLTREFPEESESPAVEAPIIPTPRPPEPVRAREEVSLQPTRTPSTQIPKPMPTQKPAAVLEKTTKLEETLQEVPQAQAIPKTVTQVTESTERDVSPISKAVIGAIPTPPKQVEQKIETQAVQPAVPKVSPEDLTAPEEKKSAELFGEAVSGDKAELLKALKKLEDL